MVYSKQELRTIYDKNDGYCYHCGKKLAWQNYGKLERKGAWEVDHSNPLSKGGSDYLRNLVPSCIPCNRSKGALHSRQFSRRTESEDDGMSFLEAMLVLGLVVIGISGIAEMLKKQRTNRWR